MAAIRRCQSNDDIKRRGLTGAIGSEKPDNLALPNPETNFIYDPASPVGLDQVFRFQDLHRVAYCVTLCRVITRVSGFPATVMLPSSKNIVNRGPTVEPRSESTTLGIPPVRITFFSD